LRCKINLAASAALDGIRNRSDDSARHALIAPLSLGLINVRFTSKSGHSCAFAAMSALCQKRTKCIATK
jgi:hypothetical protein